MSYSYKEFFQKLYQTTLPYHTCQSEDSASHTLWKEAARHHLAELLGLPLLSRAADAAPYCRQAQCLETVREDGYTRHKIKLQTLPGVYMPFYMLVPDSLPESASHRAMIAIPAHGASKESVAGVLSSPGVKEKLQHTPKENYGQRFVQNGYIVFCPDPPGYGERMEPISREDHSFLGDAPSDPLGSSCKNLTMTAEALGLSFAGLVLWDMMRLVDYVETLPMVDIKKLGCCGFSGGGLYTMWLAAMDDRVQLAIISGYLHSVAGSILDTHLCPCNFVPGLWRNYDICDIASLIAPRPLFFENGISDILNGSGGISDPLCQFHKVRQIYDLYGNPQDVKHASFEGPHMWYGLGYAFADEYLLP